LVEVKRQVPDVWLAIAGKGALRSVLEQQAHELGLQEQVKFLGYVPDEQLPIAYQAADLTVVPSQSLEGFGLILLESLACGTPVLSTPVGGMPEVLRPFQPALVTDTPDSDALAARLVDLLTGKIPLPDRSACREYAVKNYDWKIITPKVREVLLMPIDRQS
jgi:glycosyltransferase involved in cell wall biosynthesis